MKNPTKCKLRLFLILKGCYSVIMTPWNTSQSAKHSVWFPLPHLPYSPLSRGAPIASPFFLPTEVDATLHPFSSPRFGFAKIILSQKQSKSLIWCLTCIGEQCGETRDLSLDIQEPFTWVYSPAPLPSSGIILRHLLRA